MASSRATHSGPDTDMDIFGEANNPNELPVAMIIRVLQQELIVEFDSHLNNPPLSSLPGKKTYETRRDKRV